MPINWGTADPGFRWRSTRATVPAMWKVLAIIGPRGGKHESLCAKPAGAVDGWIGGREVVIPDSASPCGHRRRVRTLEERTLQLGPLGEGRRDRSLEPDYAGEEKAGGRSRPGRLFGVARRRRRHRPGGRQSQSLR